MTSTPLASVIVLNFNGADIIGRCLDHLLVQTYPNVQLIVVDNASSDGSREILERYAATHGVRVVYSAENLGCAGGRNAGLQVAEGEVIAFMDAMPQGPGHTLVMPRTPSRNLLDADPAVLGTVMAVVQKVAVAVKAAFDADGVTVMQFNEPASGQTVFHLHVHVIPRFDGVALKRHSGDMEKPELLAANAEKIKRALVG